MIKKLFKVIKNVIMAAVLLYAYNRFAISFNAIIPINVISVGLVSLLGIPAMIGLILFNFIIF